MGLATSSVPNVALLIDFLSNAYQRDLIDGTLRGARESGANVWVIVGGWFKDESLTRDENVVFQLVRKPAIDGVVAAMSSLTTLVGRATGERALRNFKLPTMSLGLNVSGTPSIGVDNRTGLVQLCEHLVRDHGFRKFAMIAGPAQNQDSQERVAVCRETLERLGAVLPEPRVTRQGFVVQSGIDGVRQLVDKGRTMLETLEAIICASDLIAEGCLRELSDRGVSAPERVAVTGFDDLERSRYLNPPLTTVRQPVVELAERATSSLLQGMRGASLPIMETLPATLVLRRSCGCLPAQARTSVAPKDELAAARPSPAIVHIMKRREPICSALSHAAQGQFKRFGVGWERRWLTAVTTDVEASGSKTFLSNLDTTLRKPGLGRQELELCLSVLAKFRDELLRGVNEIEVTRRIEDIMHAARFMTSSAMEWLEVNRWLVSSEALQGALGAFDRLTQVAGQATFWERLRHELELLSIHTCFLTEYLDGSLERSRLFWAHSSRESVPEQLREQPFPSAALLPGRLAARQRDCAMIVRALSWNGRPLGTAFLSYTAGNIASYEPLIAVMASALERSKRT